MAIELDDGTIIRSLPEQVSYNDERIEDNRNDIDTLKAQVEAALAGVFHYKGSVATYANLPATGNEVGDVYNVDDTGKNYAWSGSAWDDLGGIVDLSNLVTLNTTQTITGTKTISNTYLEFSDSGSAAQVEKGQSGLEIDMDGAANYVFGDQGDFYAQGGSALTIGTHDNPWDRAHITKYMQANNTTYGFTLPDSTSLTADSELLDTKSAQTITGAKTFDNGTIKFGTLGSFTTDTIYLKITTGGTTRLGIGNTDSYVSTNFRPSGNSGTKDLGSSIYAWKDLYLAGNINLGSYTFSDSTNLTINHGGSIITLITTTGELRSRGTKPISHNTYNLGSSDRQWLNLYLSGNISNGTDSVTVTDLAALIAYAKAQGWIS